MSEIKLNSLVKNFGGNSLAVDNLSVTFPSGEFVCLLGPSGCGKTTTLRMIAGFETATSGQIKIGERIVNDLKPADRNVAMAFEGYALYPPLTVKDNIAFSLMREKISKDKVDSKVMEVAELLEITDILERYPPSISGGQQQRVAIARAFACEADVLFCDEPTGNLDSSNSELIANLIFDTFMESSSALVIVTHDISLANRCDQKIELVDGKVL